MLCATVVIVIIAAALPEIHGAVHTVGGSAGWTQSVDYKTWASGETFAIGDTLQFNYGLSHSVDQVSNSDYDSCSSGNAIQSYSGGSTAINITSAGSMYFICPTVGHCSGGMKLAIIVQSSATAPSTTPSSPPTTPSTTPSPPSATPSTTPYTNSSPPPPTTPYNGVHAGNRSSNMALAAFSFVVSTLVLWGKNELVCNFSANFD
ncbi:hypothetical protein MLD38_023788 [Melastoma candidum]|uniref:Uncharacterized protein n=1 Tax=Melastoma candidum TaxID=119954 RepID=A0ACB9NRD5_9MYRT|nr:hypothetical protein MLD38_023788 [Melastoma candidum]